MAKNDVVVRSAADLERKYNLASLFGLKKNVEITRQGIQQIQNELNSMLNALVINLKDVLDSQGEISLWFYSGKPTVSNEPYISWNDPEEHIGDIYYDQNTGIVYQWGGLWEVNPSPDLVEAMAITNSEVDTSTDHERKVFFDTPTIPYSNGDWWVKEDGSLFICQISKTEGTYEETDFISTDNYTESVAEKVGDAIKVLKGTVTTLTENYAKFTDLATGGSTTISGDNVITGNLKSENYIANTSGTKISLNDGTIDTKNFKVDTEGNVTCNDAIINGSAILNGTKFNLDSDGNLTCNGAKINGSAIVNGDNFSVDESGKVTATAGDIGGFDLSETNFSSEVSGVYNFTMYDIKNCLAYLRKYIHSSSIQNYILDADGSGDADILDLLNIYKMAVGEEPQTQSVNAEFKVNAQDPKNCVSVICNGETTVSLGAGGINADVTNTKSLIVAAPDETQVAYNEVYGIFANGETAELLVTNNSSSTTISPSIIRTPELIQTSKESIKKNFEKFSNGIDLIKNADIYSYNLKIEEDTDKKHIGLVINDLGGDYKTPEEVIDKNNDGIDLYSMVSISWQAIKEQQTIIEGLKKEIEELKNEKESA